MKLPIWACATVVQTYSSIRHSRSILVCIWYLSLLSFKITILLHQQRWCVHFGPNCSSFGLGSCHLQSFSCVQWYWSEVFGDKYEMNKFVQLVRINTQFLTTGLQSFMFIFVITMLSFHYLCRVKLINEDWNNHFDISLVFRCYETKKCICFGLSVAADSKYRCVYALWMVNYAIGSLISCSCNEISRLTNSKSRKEGGNDTLIIMPKVFCYFLLTLLDAHNNSALCRWTKENPKQQENSSGWRTFSGCQPK